MILTEIKNGESILVDANIIIYAIERKSFQCIHLLERCVQNMVKGYLALQTLAEIMHRLMIAEAKENNRIKGSNPAKQLANQPDRVKSLFRYENFIRDILSVNFHFTSIEREDFVSAMNIQNQSGLLTNDALFIAVAKRLRIKSIASADRAFERVRDIRLYSPDDL